MKKIKYCLILGLVLSILCSSAGFIISRAQENKGNIDSSVEEEISNSTKDSIAEPGMDEKSGQYTEAGKEQMENVKEEEWSQMFTDSDSSIQDIMSRLFQEEHPIRILQKQKEDVMEVFYQRFNKEEQYQFFLLYKYAMLSEIIIDIQRAESEITQEQLNERMEWLQTFVSWIVKGSILQDQEESWKKETFLLIEKRFKDITYKQGKDTKTIIDFDAYGEYLQTISDFDVQEYMDLTNTFEATAGDEELEQTFEELKKYLYHIYGFVEKEVPVQEEKKSEKEVKEDSSFSLNPSMETSFQVTYQVHYKHKGWTDQVSDGATAGNTDEAQVINALQIKIAGDENLGITYQTYTKKEGWTDWAKDGEISGSTELPLGIESFRVKLTGINAEKYTLSYRAYCEDYNWLGWAEPEQAAGTINMSSPIKALEVKVVSKETATPMRQVRMMSAMSISPLATTSVARIGGTYYTSFDAAFAALPSGGTMYVINNCTAGHQVTSKSFTILPEERSVVITANLGTDPAGIFATPGTAPESTTGTWTLSGNGNYTLTLDGNQKCGSGILASSCSININLKSGVRLRNGITNGIWSAYGTISIYDNVEIYGNRHAGIAMWGGTTNIYGGSIYNNSGSGVRARYIYMSGGSVRNNGYVGIEAQAAVSNTSINIVGGSIYSNGADGVASGAQNGVCTTSVSGGTIYSNGSAGVRVSITNGSLSISGSANINKNAIGVVTASNTTMSGGSINSNRSSGVNTSKSFTMTGGSIYSNAAGGNGGGIYNSGSLTLSGGEIYSNSAYQGGGVYNGGSLTLNGATIRNNSSQSGGGVYTTTGITMTSGSVRNNNSSGSGGGIYNIGGTLNIQGGSINSNSSGAYGGGVLIDAGAVSNFRNTTVSGNTATLYGGGIFTNISLTLTSNVITGNRANTNSGGGVYINYQTLTLNSNNIDSNSSADLGGGIGCWQANVIMNSGTINSNTATTHGGGLFINNSTFTLNGGTINNNKTINNYGGAIFNNSSSTTNVNGGTISGNTATHGGAIFNNADCTLNVKGTNITSNTAAYGGGLFNQGGGRINMTSGTIQLNTGTISGGGIYNTIYNSKYGVIVLTGGNIQSNSSPNGSAIFQNGTLQLGGAININSNNYIRLANGNCITITSALTGSTPIMVVPNAYSNGSKIAEVTYGSKLGSLMYSRFAFADTTNYVIRPGDYQTTGAGTKAQDITVSSKYTVTYNRNRTETVTNVPAAGTKYWFENYTIPAAIPAWTYGRFKGWNESNTASTGTYQASGSVNASVNKNMALYAIWDSSVLIKYIGNTANSGAQKNDTTTYDTCLANGGYSIRENDGYTGFGRTYFKFIGWSTSAFMNPANVEYLEKNDNKISFDDIHNICTKQGTAGGDPPVMTLYAIWDKHPVITSVDKEYYEGQTITRNDLLQDIKAEDLEDGDLTSKLKIIKIAYSEGKLLDDERQAAYTESWEDGMPEDQTLDTWFLQLDENDGSVTHTITYQVTDSAGSVITQDAKIVVKYNEFPTIDAEDRYYTLDEARSGFISEEELLENAVASNKLCAEDSEDGEMSDEIKLIDFHPEEITSFNDSGYVAVTYHVQDTMGPENKGKETTKQINLYIIKDGEKIETKPVLVKYIRFINKDNYYKNADVDTESLSPAEKEERNSNGGLCVDSRWYSNSAYRGLITSLWEAENSKEVWSFMPGDVKEVKNYIEEHGIGNNREDNALNEFLVQFQNLRN
ncbi:MAG: hypothetical protein H2212_03420 [Ruminococcus sp.]|nr:hypothetical protein [Ruminococcus sp.]